MGGRLVGVAVAAVDDVVVDDLVMEFATGPHAAAETADVGGVAAVKKGEA